MESPVRHKESALRSKVPVRPHADGGRGGRHRPQRGGAGHARATSRWWRCCRSPARARRCGAAERTLLAARARRPGRRLARLVQRADGRRAWLSPSSCTLRRCAACAMRGRRGARVCLRVLPRAARARALHARGGPPGAAGTTFCRGRIGGAEARLPDQPHRAPAQGVGRAAAQPAAPPTVPSTGRQRLQIAFGCDGGGWDEEKVLERYELMCEAGLAGEPANGSAKPAALSMRLPRLRHPLQGDQTRVLASAIGEMRRSLKFRP